MGGLTFWNQSWSFMLMIRIILVGLTAVTTFSLVCAYIMPRVPTHTSHWVIPVVIQQRTHLPMWAVQACQSRTAPGRRASWAIWQAAFGVCITYWRACLRGTNRLLPQQPRAAHSLVQVLMPTVWAVQYNYDFNFGKQWPQDNNWEKKCYATLCFVSNEFLIYLFFPSGNQMI